MTLVSDLSGEEIEEGGETVEFALDGVVYEIDLAAAEAGELRDQLAVFVEHARRTGGRRSGRSSRTARASSGSSATDRAENQKIREWAKAHGYDVSDRGRIPSSVTEAYRAA